MSEENSDPVYSVRDFVKKYGKIPDHKILSGEERPPGSASGVGSTGLRHRQKALENLQKRGPVPFVTSEQEKRDYSTSRRGHQHVQDFIAQKNKVNAKGQKVGNNTIRGSLREILKLRTIAENSKPQPQTFENSERSKKIQPIEKKFHGIHGSVPEQTRGTFG